MNTFDNLCKLMAFPSYLRRTIVDVTRTSDGHYLAMDRGDIGFNRFIGKPAPPHRGPGRDAILAAWASMSGDEKHTVLMLAVNKGINLKREFGVPTEDVPMFEAVS